MKKQALNYFAVIAFGAFFIFGSLKIYSKNVGLDLNETTKIEGQVTKTFTTSRKSGTKGKKSLIFAFTLNTLEFPLGIYRPSKDYNYLLKNINIGDTLTIYYNPSKDREINIDVYQIEKSEQVILDYESYSKNHLTLVLFLGVAGLLFFVIGIIKIVKLFNSR